VYIVRLAYPDLSCDLDLDPVTFTYERNLHILKMHKHITMKFLGQSFQKLEHKRDRQTDMQTDATETITTAAFAGGRITYYY